MEQYNKIIQCVTEYGCKLLTTFEEFQEKMRTNKYRGFCFVRIEFVGICGHNSSAVFTNFKVRKTGIRCKDCVKKSSAATMCENNTKLQSIQTELESVKLIEKYLTGYDIIRTPEGCLADIIVREKGSEELWIPIQLKCTLQLSHGMYSFRKVGDKYKDMLLVCVCINENKIWVIPANDINVTNELNISKVSKYNEYSVADNSLLCSAIDLHKERCIRKSLEDCMRPLSELQQREQIFVKKRVSALPFLSFKMIDMQQSSTDFIVNGKKVQEKVCGYIKNKNQLMCAMSCNNGTENKKRLFRTYRLKENDFYWLHSSIDDRFWVIPEAVMFREGYVSKEDETIGKKGFSIPLKDMEYGIRKWMQPFEYNYSTPDKDKLLALFGCV
jgi:hypothetical protein